jgi:thiol-disulfide isomerase/thioredoxin
MNSSNQGRERQPSRKFWTVRRSTLSLITLALLATLGVSSCTQPDSGSTTNANTPAANSPGNSTTTVKNQPASGNNSGAPVANNAATPPTSDGALRSIPLPASLLDTQLTTIDGKSLKFSDYKGKIVVINLWASWCGPCRVETPELIEMSKEYKSQGVEFVGLTTKGNDPDVEPIKEFVREQQVPYKTVWDDGRFAGPLTQAVRARAVIPQSFVLLRDGSIYKHFEGFNQVETPRRLREAIEQAVNAKS